MTYASLPLGAYPLHGGFKAGALIGGHAPRAQLTTVAALPSGGGCIGALPAEVHSSRALLPIHDAQWLKNSRHRPLPEWRFAICPARAGTTEAFAALAAQAFHGEDRR